MPRIELTNVTKRWGNYFAVDNLNMVIEDNSFITLLGPSGCGKTTTLRMIAGLETPTSGKITIGGVTVFDSDAGINIPANKRRVGFLFQNYALWPNMTVYNNISFGLKNLKEMLPDIDFDVKNYTRIIEILAKPEQIISIINDCKDNKGIINSNRALIKLIDFYEVSLYTAKTLLGFDLHLVDNYQEVANKFTNKYQNKLAEILKNYQSNELKLNHNFEMEKNGQVITSIRKLTKEEIDLRVRRVSRIVKIGEFMDRYPSELSGGQQQRVAIARTLAPEPVVLFMDEPLSNLDAKLRLEMRSELQRLHIDTGSTFVYVTHDQLEAMTLATKICLINNGVLQQYEAPLDVYKKPINLFVADFVGNPSINFINAKGKPNQDGSIELSFFDKYSGTFIPNTKLNLDEWHTARNRFEKQEAVEADDRKKTKSFVEKLNKDLLFKYRIAKINEGIDIKESTQITRNDFVIGVRPEFIKFDTNGTGPIKGQIYSVMPAGMETTVKINVDNYLLTGVIFGGIVYAIGEDIHLDFAGNELLIFDRASGRLLAQGSFKIGF